MWKIFYWESDSQILISTSILNFRYILFSFFTLFKNQKRWQDEINTRNAKNSVISRLYAYISKLVEFKWTIINRSLNLLPTFGMILCNAENFYFPILRRIFSRAIAIYCSPIQIHAITVLARKLICWPSPFTIDSPFNKIINLFIILVIAMDPINIRLITDY